MKKGTLVCWHSNGSTYYGFIVGTCSYDNCGEDNAYVVRYVWKVNEEAPYRPFSIVEQTAVELVTEWDDKFYIGGHWSRTPNDRCLDWKLSREKDRLAILSNQSLENE